jgi:small-conductance mechanosensitive channel
MKKLWSDMNPTLRGFLIIGVIVLLIVVLSLEETVISLHIIARIAFFIAIAFVLYLLWRDRVREDAESWPSRARWTFYGGGALILVDVGAFTLGYLRAGLDAVAFLAVLAFCGFAMYRVWQDQHRYSY